jgi:hypothetical protein
MGEKESAMSREVTAIFDSSETASVAVDRLIDAGFSRDDVSMLVSESTRGRVFGIEEHTKAAEGAATGGALGGTLGALGAGLVAVGAITIPGVGLAAAGPLVAALAGAGAGGAAGGLTGAFVGMGIREHEARVYADQVQNGRLLLGVHAHEDRVDRAKQILKNTGGTAVHG